MPPFPAESVLVLFMRARGSSILNQGSNGAVRLPRSDRCVCGNCASSARGLASYPDALIVATLISSSHGGSEHLGAILVDTGKTPQSF